MEQRRLFMTRIYLFFTSFSVICSVVSSSTSCYSFYPTYLKQFYDEIQDSHTTSNTLHECVKMCRPLPRCKAFLFYRDLNFCGIYHMDSSTYDSTRMRDHSAVVVFDKSVWKLGPCGQHTCTADERCHPTGTSYVCTKAVDVCFKRMYGDVCFRRHKSVAMNGDYDIGHTAVHSLYACVLFCDKHHATYKAMSFDGHNCRCYSILVSEYERTVGILPFSNGDTHDKIN